VSGCANGWRTAALVWTAIAPLDRRPGPANPPVRSRPRSRSPTAPPTSRSSSTRTSHGARVPKRSSATNSSHHRERPTVAAASSPSAGKVAYRTSAPSISRTCERATKEGVMNLEHALTLAQARSFVAALADAATDDDASAAFERVLIELDWLHGDDSPGLD